MRRLSNAVRGYQESKESESKLAPEHDGLETLDAGSGTLAGGTLSKSTSSWQAVFDPSISATYYYNSSTGESSWEAPEGFKDFLGSDGGIGVASPSKRSVTGAVPLPSIFSLARSALEAKKALLRRKHKIVEQIRIEFVQFEQEQQKILREEIARLEGLIDVESEKDKMDIKSVLCSLQGLSDAFSKKKEEESQNSAPEKKLKAIWGEYETESEALRAILVAERDRQKHKLQDRLEKLKVDRIRHKVEEVQKALEKRRQRDVSRMQAVESQFKAVMTVREACLKAARARVQNKPSTSAADAAAGQATPSSVHSGSEAWVVDGMTTPQPIVWIELIDNDDNVYYYNTVTGESSWDKPSEMCLGGAYGTSGPTTSEDVENSEKLAAEWVSQDVLDYERGVTLQLENKIKELNKALEEMRQSTADNTLQMLEELMADTEMTVDDTIAEVNNSYSQDVRRLSEVLVHERNRQRSKLQARLRERQARIDAERESAEKAIQLKRVDSEKVLHEVKKEANKKRLQIKVE